MQNGLNDGDIRLMLDDPSLSHWFINAMKTALERDPVDAANDAEILALVLERRAASCLLASKLAGRAAESLRFLKSAAAVL
jgi:hypothetical protein